MRTIDADAFDATMYEAWMNCEITNEEWFHFREMIKDEPTIEPPKWIPVTEALPEDCVAVWVTIRGHDVIRCEGDETLEQAIDRVRKMVRVEGGFYVADEKSWYNENGFPMMVQPVAWMPMEVPEPWRGEEHEL